MRYKHIKNALKQAQYGQITLDNILSGRFYHKTKGWTNIKIDDIELDALVDRLGGRNREYIKARILYVKSIGILERLYYDKHGWHYCAGQDYPSELRFIRNYIIKN